MPTHLKSVLITGCSAGGLGSALALEFAKRGHYHIFATGRNPAKLQHLRDIEHIEVLTLDVESTQSIQECVNTISMLTSSSLDMLINNAGSGYMLPLSDISISDAKASFDLNVWSALALTQACLPLLINAKGMVVMQSSVGSVVPVTGLGIYSASKAALSMLADTLRVEMIPFGVKVVDLKTGSVRTNFHGNLGGGNQGKAVLPEGSLYAPIKTEIESVMNGTHKQDEERKMNPKEWAKAIVGQLVKSNPPAQIWKGGGSGAIWWIRSFLPHTIIDGTLAKMAGLDRLEELLRGTKTSAQ